MNKLGFYLEVANTDGLPQAIEKIKPPTLLIHAGHHGLLTDIRRHLSPETFIVGRWFVETDQTDAWLSSSDPAARGRELAETIVTFDHPFALERINGRLLIDAWMSLNECLPGPASEQYKDGTDQDRALLEARARAYDLFQVGFRQRLKEADGELEAVAFNFGAGNFQTAEHYLDWFPETLTSYVYLGFHEYGWPALSSSLHPEAASSAGTYRSILEGIRHKHGDQHKVIITEAGLARMYKHPKDPAGDVGWLYGPDSVSQEEYWRSLHWYNGHMSEDDYVLGACLFEVGHRAPKWESFRHLGVDNGGRPIEIIDWMAAQREPTTSTQPGAGSPGEGGGETGEPATGGGAGPGSGQPGAVRIDPRIAAFLGLEADEANVYRLAEVVWMDAAESQGRRHIFADVVDRQGKRVAGEKLRVSWPGGAAEMVVEEKAGEPWGANFAMSGVLGSYAVEVVHEGGLSDRLTGLGMGTPDQPAMQHLTSFGLRYRKL